MKNVDKLSFNAIYRQDYTESLSDRIAAKNLVNTHSEIPFDSIYGYTVSMARENAHDIYLEFYLNDIVQNDTDKIVQVNYLFQPRRVILSKIENENIETLKNACYDFFDAFSRILKDPFCKVLKRIKMSDLSDIFNQNQYLLACDFKGFKFALTTTDDFNLNPTGIDFIYFKYPENGKYIDIFNGNKIFKNYLEKIEMLGLLNESFNFNINESEYSNAIKASFSNTNTEKIPVKDIVFSYVVPERYNNYPNNSVYIGFKKHLLTDFNNDIMHISFVSYADLKTKHLRNEFRKGLNELIRNSILLYDDEDFNANFKMYQCKNLIFNVCYYDDKLNSVYFEKIDNSDSFRCPAEFVSCFSKYLKLYNQLKESLNFNELNEAEYSQALSSHVASLNNIHAEKAAEDFAKYFDCLKDFNKILSINYFSLPSCILRNYKIEIKDSKVVCDLYFNNCDLHEIIYFLIYKKPFEKENVFWPEYDNYLLNIHCDRSLRNFLQILQDHKDLMPLNKIKIVEAKEFSINFKNLDLNYLKIISGATIEKLWLTDVENLGINSNSLTTFPKDFKCIITNQLNVEHFANLITCKNTFILDKNIERVKFYDNPNLKDIDIFTPGATYQNLTLWVRHCDRITSFDYLKTNTFNKVLYASLKENPVKFDNEYLKNNIHIITDFIVNYGKAPFQRTYHLNESEKINMNTQLSESLDLSYIFTANNFVSEDEDKPSESIIDMEAEGIEFPIDNVIKSNVPSEDVDTWTLDSMPTDVINSDPLPIQDYPPTSLQQDAIENGDAAIVNGKTHLLLAAVMRFGKTFTAYNIVKDCNMKYTIITSAKADTRESWRNDIYHKNFIVDDDFVFVEFNQENHDEILVSDKDGYCKKYDYSPGFIEQLGSIDSNKVIFYATLQDLSGKLEDNGPRTIKERHEEIFNMEWDMLIADETHFATRSKVNGKALGFNEAEEIIAEDEASENAEIIRPLKTKVQLHLSGTPYNILASHEFDYEDSEIIGRYEYFDMVNARDKWIEDNGDVPEWRSPFFGVPNIIKLGLEVPESAKDIITKFDSFRNKITTSLSRLFETTGSESFMHENEVMQLFEGLFGNYKEGKEIKGLLNESKAREADIFKHVVICLPNVIACHAVANMLKNQIFTSSMNKRNVVVAVENDKTDHLDQVAENANTLNKFLNESESRGERTVTLTVTRFLTAVSIPLWDTIIYLKDTENAQEYDQNIFRVCTRNVKKIKEAGKTVNIINLKKNAYLIDFKMERMFDMFARSINSKKEIIGHSHEESQEEVTKKLEKMPIYVDSGKGFFAKLDVENYNTYVENFYEEDEKL